MRKKISIYHHKFLPLSETFIYRQIQGLSEYFDSKVLIRELVNEDEYPNINPIFIPSQNYWGRLIDREQRFFDKHLKGSDLFHVNFGNEAINMEPVASSLGLPITAYFLGVDASAALKNTDYCRKLKDSSFAAVFVNSENMKKRLMAYLPPNVNCQVVYCGIPLEKFPFKQRLSVPDGALFLQISRLDSKKGFEFTLKAFSRYVANNDSTARLVVVGDGPLKENLLSLAKELRVGEKVSFIGAVGYQRYVELLQSADVFIHPSVTAENGDMEGLPTVICEAMSCGMPVISTKHSGIPEIIDHGKNGLLVDERDVDGLYESMLLLRNTDVCMLSKNARVKVEEKFDDIKTLKLLAEHMKDIIG